MNWSIEYYSEKVQQEIFELPEGLQARYIHLTNIMLSEGANLGEPHTKAIGDGLFELRLKGKEGIARIIYCTIINKKIVILHSFIKKTQKIPGKEFKLAKQRMNEIKKRG